MRTLPAVEQRVSFVTVATADLDAARAFYLRGLGWRPLLDVPGEVLFLQVGHGLVLSLYDAARFAADLDGAPALTSLPPASRWPTTSAARSRSTRSRARWPRPERRC